MRFFLASRTHNPETIEQLRQYIGGFAGKKIAYIPTAANGEDGWESWKTKEDGSWKFINTLGADVRTVVLEEYRNESVIEELEGKDIIWFAGGAPGYLMYWIRRCGLDIHIKRLLKKGALYFGASAGAMVAGKTLQVSAWRFVDGERGAKEIGPMNLVDFDIFPHFQDEYLPEIREKYKGEKLYLLKDGEEIIVEDGKITVIGEERIVSK